MSPPACRVRTSGATSTAAGASLPATITSRCARVAVLSCRLSVRRWASRSHASPLCTQLIPLAGSVAATLSCKPTPQRGALPPAPPACPAGGRRGAHPPLGRPLDRGEHVVCCLSAPACRARQARVVSHCPGCRAVPGIFLCCCLCCTARCCRGDAATSSKGAQVPCFNQSQQITKTGRTGTPGRTPAKAKTPGRPRTSGAGSKTPRTADGGVAKRRASSSAKKAKPAAAAGEAAATPASPASGRRGRRSSQGASASRAARAAAAAPAEDDWQEQQEQAAGNGGWCSIM